MNSPPIKVWIIVFVISASSFATYSWFSSNNFGVQAEANKIDKLIISNNKIDSSKTSIVIVGSSITRCAFGTHKNNLQQRISDQIRKPATLLNISISSLNLERASELKIFKMISENPPNILFVESRFLLKFFFNPKKIPFHLTNSIRFNISELKVKLGMLTKNDTNLLISPVWPPCYFNGVFDNATCKEIINRKRIAIGFNENTELNEAFAIMRAKGTKIIFLGYPNIASINKSFAKNNSELVPIFNQYNKVYQVEYWQNSSIPSENKYYSDGSHMNNEGSKKYVEWFLTQIKNKL